MDHKPHFLSLLVLAGTACGPAPPAGSPPPADPPAASTEPPLELFAFDCGRIGYDSLQMLGVADTDTDVREMIVPCFVIEHEKGRLLWDGGLPSSQAETEGWAEMEGGWRMRLDRTFAEQIGDQGLSMGDFDYMAFSHFHFDHVGIANEIEGAKPILQRKQHELAFLSEPPPPGYSPELYDRLEASELLLLDGEHDVFGDGRVRLIPAPGHTPGHQVLFLELSDDCSVVLSGDLYVLEVARRQQQALAIDADPEQSLESMQTVEALLEESGAALWIGHDLASFERITRGSGSGAVEPGAVCGSSTEG